MTSSRPYLLRALNQWILDNGFTPYVVVDAGVQGVQVPQDFVSKGQIVLNINPEAVKELMLNDDSLEFSARFGGVPMSVYVPILAIIAIYAKENSQGMVFGSEPGLPLPPEKGGAESSKSLKNREKPRPSLSIVK